MPYPKGGSAFQPKFNTLNMNFFKAFTAFFICLLCVSCITEDEQRSSGIIDTTLDLRSCPFSCDPNSSSGVTIVSAQSVGNQCCVIFSLLGGSTGGYPLCYRLKTYDGQTVYTYSGVTVKDENEFEVCFIQVGECFIIELVSCATSISAACNVFSNQC